MFVAEAAGARRRRPLGYAPQSPAHYQDTAQFIV